jgi:hypothetical protein
VRGLPDDSQASTRARPAIFGEGARPCFPHHHDEVALMAAMASRIAGYCCQHLSNCPCRSTTQAPGVVACLMLLLPDEIRPGIPNS